MRASLIAMHVEGVCNSSPKVHMLHAHNCYTVIQDGDLKMLMLYVASLLDSFAHDALSISCYVRLSYSMPYMQLESRRRSAMSTSQLQPNCLPFAQETRREESQLRMVLSLCQTPKNQLLRTQHCHTLRR